MDNKNLVGLLVLIPLVVFTTDNAYAVIYETFSVPQGIVTDAISGVNCGSTSYFYSSATIGTDPAALTAGCRNAFLTFNVTDIPDDSTINSVTFKETTALVNGANRHCNWVSIPANHYSTSVPASTIWADLRNGTIYKSGDTLCNNSPAATNKTSFLLSGATTRMETSINTSNRFSFGVHWTLDSSPDGVTPRDAGTYFSFFGVSYIVVDYTPPPAAPTPSLITQANATAQNTSAYLQWTQNVPRNTTNYDIYRNGTLIDTISNTTLQYQDTTVIKNTHYIYGIKPWNKPVGYSRTDGILFNTNVVLTNNVPSAPLNLIANYTSPSQITTSWNPPSSNGNGSPVYPSLTITNYKVYSRDLPAGVFVQNGFIVNPATSRIINATFPQEKEFKVSACNVVGCGANSTVAQALSFPISTPVLTASNNVAGGINATWTNQYQNGITGYTLYNSTNGFLYTKLITVSNGTLFYFDNPHPVCYSQYYKVSPFTALRNGTNSTADQGSVNCVFTSTFANPTLENIGDTFKVTGSISVAGGNLTKIVLLENGLITDQNATGYNTTMPAVSHSFNYLFWERADSSTSNFTVRTTGQSPSYLITNTQHSTVGNREYPPNYFDAIVETEGKVNYTLNRFNNSQTLQLKVNRLNAPAGETWQIECIYQTVFQALATKDTIVPDSPTISWVGTWRNFTNTGYENSTAFVGNGNVYVSCFNTNLLFSTVSYSNSSLALQGIGAFDITFGSLLGVPVGIFFIIISAGMANKRTSPTWIIVLIAMAGIMATIGFFTLEPLVWGLALMTAMLGILVNQKIF